MQFSHLMMQLRTWKGTDRIVIKTGIIDVSQWNVKSWGKCDNFVVELPTASGVRTHFGWMFMNITAWSMQMTNFNKSLNLRLSNFNLNHVVNVDHTSEHDHSQDILIYTNQYYTTEWRLDNTHRPTSYIVPKYAIILSIIDHKFQ